MGFPTNAADAVSAIKNGVLGLLEEIKIGDLVVSALTGLEAPSRVTITDKPIESGMAITEAIVRVPQTIVMDILLANPQYSVENVASSLLSGNPSNLAETWRDKKAQLYQYQKDYEIISAQTHEGVYDSVVIEEINPWYDVDENYDAFFATVTLRELPVNEAASSGGLLDSAKEALGGL